MLNGLYLGNDCEQRRTDNFPIFPLKCRRMSPDGVVGVCVGTIKLAGLDACWSSKRSASQERGEKAAYHIVHFIRLHKRFQSTINTCQYEPRIGPNDGQGMDLHLDMLNRPYPSTVANEDAPILSRIPLKKCCRMSPG